jgi:alanyl-tRNA synthetase
MKAAEIREKYQKFFEAKGHTRIPSASLIPQGDATTLFTGSGMQPMVPYLLGQKHPIGTRLVDSQKCFRAEDIGEVGDNRHTTFFEMLGNWSLGDYWKTEQINWIFEFLTNEIGIDPNKLYVSVFAGNEKYKFSKDTKAGEIWRNLFASKNIDAREIDLISEENASKKGMQDGRIFYYQDKNWWSRAGLPEAMPVGEPGGPDSEIFYEFSEIQHDTKYGEYCHPNCDCGRYLEIGNCVFMQYKKQSDEAFVELSQKNVDFGGGLERIAAASNNNPDVFYVDVLQNIIVGMKKTYGWDYDSATEEEKRTMRLVADHLRAAVFLIGDGVLPSNKLTGYVLRRLIRRAVFNAYRFGKGFSNLYPLVNIVIDSYENADFYAPLKEKSRDIHKAFEDEEVRFMETLKTGFKEFDKFLSANTDRVSGEKAFYFYQSLGLPLEVVREELIKRQLPVDEKELQDEIKKHQDLSRTASAGTFKGGLASHSEKVLRLHTATHLMNAALRKILGDKVFQKGSNITEERTRFDFTHDAKMTDEQKQQVEQLVNSWVQADLPVNKEIMPIEKARELNAIGVFGEKYGDSVSIYTIGDPAKNMVVSREFCGGPHVERTGIIGKFKIQKEEAVSAGVRRIKAIVE